MDIWNQTTTSLPPGDLLYPEGPGSEGPASEEVLGGEGNATTNVTNTSDSSTQRQFYAIVMPVVFTFCVASGLVSSAVVCATPWVKRPMSPTVRLSLSLAAANTVFSFSLAVAVVVNSYLPVVHGIFLTRCLKLFIEAVRMGSILVQILHLMVVALNHYIGTLRPLHYAATMTPSTLKIILVALWIIPMAGMFVAFGSIPGQGFSSPMCENNYFYVQGITFRIVWTALFFGPTVLISIIYCHIFHLLKNRALYLVSAEQRSQLRRSIKTIRTTALIVGTFVLGWGPAVVRYMLVCDECLINPSSISMTIHIAMGVTVNIIYCLKVFTDTFIYAVQLRDVRKALQMMWALVKARVTGQHSGPLRHMSRISHTTSTRISLNSPALRRIGTSGGLGGAPAAPPPYNPSWTPVSLEVSVYSNNHHSDDLRLKTVVEETPLDPIHESDPDHL